MSDKQRALMVRSKYARIGLLQAELDSLQRDINRMQAECSHKEQLNDVCTICLHNLITERV